MAEFLTVVLVTLTSLLPICNPPSTAVLFLTLTAGYPKAHQDREARMAAVYMTGILLIFFAGGSLIMTFFGISLPGVRIAGGLIIARIGFGMLQTDPPEEVSEDTKEEAQHMRDIAFTPLAMPSLAGPGAIAVAITMASRAQGITGHLAVAIGIILVAAIAWLILRSAPFVVKFLGATGLNALTRVMGFLLVCVGVQFVVIGVHGFFVDESLARPFLEMLDRVRAE
ncbi:MAG: MarC family NAAT transporter [Gammaproteobacteria bacterium]|nr:MarC family NAAT transporter [Gammaproteobacteria bacterium]